MDKSPATLRVQDYVIATIAAELATAEAVRPVVPPAVEPPPPPPPPPVANLVNRPDIIRLIETRAMGLVLTVVQHAIYWLRNRLHPQPAPVAEILPEPLLEPLAEPPPEPAAPLDEPPIPIVFPEPILADLDFAPAILVARPRILIDVTPTARQPHARGGIPRLVRDFARAGVETGLALPVVIENGVMTSYWYDPGLAGPIVPDADDIYVIIDIYWYFLGEYLPMVRSVRAAGGRVALFVHDIFPLRFPAFYPQEVPPTFGFGLRSFLAECDWCFTISADGLQALRQWLDEAGFAGCHRIAFGVVHLAAPDRPDTTGVVRPHVAALFEHENMFLSVGTLEPRKGYSVTLNAMDLLWAAGTDAGLVIIGRYGWRAQAVRARILHHPEYGRRLFWLQDADDAELYHAYARCRSLVQSSIDEGFGLPVVEAGLAGAPIIASDLAVFHEIGGEGLVTVPVVDAPALARALTQCLTVARRPVAIPPRRWADTIRTLAAHLGTPMAPPSAMQPPSALPRIHVACCFDDSMAMPACVLAASIAAATTDAHVTLIMLHTAGLSVDLDALRRTLESDCFVIEPHEVGESLADLARTDQYTEAMYFRFLLPDIVRADRVIYLDCDTLVRRSLRALYATDLQGMALAAAVDHGLVHHMRGHAMPVLYEGSYLALDDYARDVLQFDLIRTSYFNSGVLVIDLARWRDQDLSARCIAFCRAHAGLVMADQDALNHVLQGAFAHLDPRWNAISYLRGEYFPPPGEVRPSLFGGFEEHFRTPQGEWSEILMQWAFDPWIVHFTFRSKPWVPGHRRTAYDGEYWTRAATTPIGEAFRAKLTGATE